MKIPIVGAAYRSRSLNMSSDVCINLYPEVSEMDGNVRALYGTPGLRRLCTLPNTGGIRGLFAPAIGKLIAVQGNKVYRVDGNWNITPCPGILLTDTGAVSIAENGTTAVIVDGNNGYTLDLASNVVARINNDAFYGADRVGFIDGYFVFNKPDTQQFYISSLYGTSFDGLDFASAEGAPDLLVSLLVDHREVWMFGETTTEVFYNSGNADFPIERMQGAYLEHGCAAAQSVAKLDNTVFWVGRDSNGNGTVWRANGYTPQRVSTHALEFALQSYSQISDAIAYTYQKDGHAFYVLTFPQANKTWCYDVSTNLWHERAYWNAGNFERHRSNCLAFYGGKHVVGDYENGKLYWLDSDYYMDDDQPLVAQRSTPAINADGKRLFHKSIQIEIEEGVGTNPDLSIYIANMDEDAQSIVRRMTGALTFPILIAIQDGVTSLKEAGTWYKLDTLEVLAANVSANMLDWIRPVKPTYSSGTFTAYQGYTAASATGMNSLFSPAADGVNYTQNDAEYGVYLFSTPTTGNGVCGTVTNFTHSSRLALYGDGSTGSMINTWGDTSSASGGGYRSGLLSVVRTASNAVAVYDDNALIGSGSAASSGLPVDNFVIGNDDSALNSTDAKITAFYAGASLTSGERSALLNFITDYTDAITP